MEGATQSKKQKKQHVSEQRESLVVNAGFRGPLGQMILFHVCFDHEPL